MNVIDALFVTIGLDTKAYDAGKKGVDTANKQLREDSDKTSKAMVAGHKRVVDGLSSLKTGLLEVVAIVAAGMGFKAFLADELNSQAALSRMSKNLSINTKELDAWGTVAEEMGGRAADAFGALQSVAGALAEASIKGPNEFTMAARANGVALTDMTGKALNSQDVLISISKRMQELPRQQGIWLANQLGVGGMAQQLLLGPQELKRRLDEATRISKVTNESAAAAEVLQYKWGLMELRFKAIRDTAWNKLEPVLEKLGDRLANWLDKIDWDKVGTGIEELVDGVLALVNAMGGWKNVIIAIGAIMGLKLLTPVFTLLGYLTRMIPLLTASAAGMTTLAAGIAAVAGALVGLGITKMIEGTKVGDWVQRGVAQTAASLGDKDAESAVIKENWARLTPEMRAKYVNAYQGLSPAEKALYEKTAPELTQLVKQQLAVRSGIASSSSQGPGVTGGSGQERVSGSDSRPRGVRNNNPGNLNYVGQPGAHLEGPGGRFAAFGTMDEGVSALQTQLVRYIATGTDTIRKIVNKYAPAGDHNDVNAYIADLVKQTGDQPDQQLGANDVKGLMKGIINHEGNGRYVTDADIQSGLNFGATQRAMAKAGNVSHSTKTSEVTIGEINVHTPATDGKGVAQDLRNDLAMNSLIGQSDTGLN